MAKLDLTYITRLVLDAKNGSSDAFAELFAATYQEQYHFAYTYLEDEFLAMDSLQQTYLQLHQELPRISDANLFLAQLRHTGYRICYAAKRTQKDTSDHFEQLMISINGTSHAVSRILTLPFTESQILLMKYGDHMTNGTIARMMNLSRRAVNSYEARGRKRLQKIMNVES